jgi:hypothetical protein
MMSGNSGNITITETIQKNYQGKKIKVTENNFRVFWRRAINPITMITNH